MFSSAFLFVRRIMQYYLTDFHKIRWKGGSWTTRETTRFGGGVGNPDHVTLGLRFGYELWLRLGGARDVARRLLNSDNILQSVFYRVPF